MSALIELFKDLKILLIILGAVFILLAILGKVVTKWASIDVSGKFQRTALASLGIIFLSGALLSVFWNSLGLTSGTCEEVSCPSYWPPNLVSYYDYETDADLERWEQKVERSDEHVFSGKYALKAILPVQADQETKFRLEWREKISAEVILGQIYWPPTDKVKVVWAQVCVPFTGNWPCVKLKLNGGWKTFAMVLSQMTEENSQQKLNQLVLPGLVIHGVLRGTKGINATSIFIDAIQTYHNGSR